MCARRRRFRARRAAQTVRQTDRETHGLTRGRPTNCNSKRVYGRTKSIFSCITSQKSPTARRLRFWRSFYLGRVCPHKRKWQSQGSKTSPSIPGSSQPSHLSTLARSRGRHSTYFNQMINIQQRGPNRVSRGARRARASRGCSPLDPSRVCHCTCVWAARFSHTHTKRRFTTTIVQWECAMPI